MSTVASHVTTALTHFLVKVGNMWTSLLTKPVLKCYILDNKQLSVALKVIEIFNGKYITVHHISS